MKTLPTAAMALLLVLAATGTSLALEPAAATQAKLDRVCSRTAEYDCYTNHKYGYVLASFELVYASSDKTLFDPVIRDLASSFSIDPAFGYQ